MPKGRSNGCHRAKEAGVAKGARTQSLKATTIARCARARAVCAARKLLADLSPTATRGFAHTHLSGSIESVLHIIEEARNADAIGRMRFVAAAAATAAAMHCQSQWKVNQFSLRRLSSHRAELTSSTAAAATAERLAHSAHATERKQHLWIARSCCSRHDGSVGSSCKEKKFAGVDDAHTQHWPQTICVHYTHKTLQARKLRRQWQQQQ